MACEYCHGVMTHSSLCPNYVLKRLNKYCSYCGECIYEGEEYIEKDDGECRHMECFYSLNDLAKWLGYEIRIMEDIENDQYI